MLFELAAAWDHVSRFWRYNEREERCADMAARHLKRAVFDAYKLLAKKVADDFDDLKRIDTSLVDNGEFDRNVRALISEIRQAVIDARTAEGDSSGQNGWTGAFDAWVAADEKMQRFWMDYYLNPSVEWARRKTIEFNWKRRLEGLLLGVFGSLIAAAVWWYFSH
jgi:hypothetical protein